MKSVVAVAVFMLIASTFALTVDQRKKAETYATDCVKSTGVPADTPTKLRMGEFDSVDKNAKCFTKCFLEKAGFMNAAGDIQEKTVIEKLSIDHDKAKIEALTKKCNQKQADPCDTAFKAFQCFHAAKAAIA